MERAYDAATLRKELDLLNSRQKLAFGASCCTRLVPNYLAFFYDTGWGNIGPLKDAIDLIWASLDAQSRDIEVVKKLTAACEASAPDSDDFTSLYVSFAQDACFSICGLLEFLLSDDSEKIIQAATYATDSVDLFVQEIEDMESNAPDLEQQILVHPLMQRELKKQHDDLLVIAQAADLDADFLTRLRNSSDNSGKSNLDLP